MIKRTTFLFCLYLLNTNLLFSQTEKINDWKVDSLLQILGHPKVSYDFNFNFSFSELNGEDTTKVSPLATLTETELKNKLAGTPEDAKVYAQLVYRGLEEGNQEKILDALQKGASNYQEYINNNPEDSLAVEELAMMMAATQNYSYAMQTLDYGIKEFPRYEALHISRFQVLFYNLGNMDLAGAYIDSLLQVFPDNETLAYMGFLKNYQFHIIKSEGEIKSIDSVMLSMREFFQREPENNSREFLYRFCKAFLYMNIKTVNADKKGEDGIDVVILKPEELLKEEYIKDIESTIAFLDMTGKNEKLPKALTSKISAMCYVLLGKPKMAEENLKKSISLLEDDKEKNALEEALALLKLMQTKDEREKSIEIVKKKYERVPSPKDLLILSLFYHLDEKPEKAKEYILKAIERYPDFGTAWQMKAYLELTEKDLPAVLATFNKTTAGADPVYDFLLKIIYTSIEEGAEVANQNLQTLLDSQPENKEALAFRELLKE